MAELEVIETVGERYDVAVGLVDVKSYWVETPEEIDSRVRRCLQYVPADRLALARTAVSAKRRAGQPRPSWPTW